MVHAFQRAYIRPLKWSYKDGADQCSDGKYIIGEVKQISNDDFEWWVDNTYQGNANTRENAMIAIEVLHRAKLPPGIDYDRFED